MKEIKKYVLAVLAGCGLAAMAVGPALPAVAMPVEVGSAEDTVNRLQSEGYRVILNKVGTAPLSQCAVTAVREGRDVRTRVNELGAGEGTVESVLYTTVLVDVTC